MDSAPQPDFRKWLSIVTLTAAGGMLLLVLYWIVSAAISPAAAGCHNAPLRVTRFPQVGGVLICSAGFILGRVTARPKIDARSDLKSWTDSAEDEVGEARASLLTQSALTVALFFIACLIAFEAVTLANSVWPITYYLRCASEAATWQTLVAGFAFCFLAGRWLWLPMTPEGAK